MGNCTGMCQMKEDPKDISQINVQTPKPNETFQKKDEDKCKEADIIKNGKLEEKIKPQIEKENNKEEEVDIDMDFMKENEEKIVKMQAKMKGNLARKQMKGDKQKKNTE